MDCCEIIISSPSNMKKFNDTWQEVKIKSKIHILHDFLYIKQGNMCSKWLYFLSSCEILLQVILLRLRRYLSIFSEFSIHMISKIRKLFWKRVYKDRSPETHEERAPLQLLVTLMLRWSQPKGGGSAGSTLTSLLE